MSKWNKFWLWFNIIMGTLNAVRWVFGLTNQPNLTLVFTCMNLVAAVFLFAEYRLKVPRQKKHKKKKPQLMAEPSFDFSQAQPRAYSWMDK